MSHNNGAGGQGGSSMVLYITSDISTTGSVSIGNSLLQNFSVTANQVTFIEIPTTAYLNGFGKFSTSGIHITSVKPIAVYAHIYASNVSGATLLLPVNAMGKEYLSLNYAQLSNAPSTNPAFSTFAVIATEDNTTVSITPSAMLLDNSPANVPFNIVLNKGEVYQGLASTDLTGTKIQSISNSTGSCKKIAVFSGSSRIGIGCNTSNTSNANQFSSDNLFQQVYPTSTWGKNYVTAPLRSRPFDVYRIVLSDPSTVVTLNGTQLNTPSFVNGLYYEFNSTTTNVISADKPIQVVQYSPSQNQTLDCTRGTGDIGDPEMIYLSPVEQGLNHVTLYSTGYYAIRQSYINVVIPNAGVSSFTLDGVSYSTSFSPVSNTSYSYAQISVTSGPQSTNANSSLTSGTHTISASVPFNAIAYGFGSTESYGYAAGTNLQDLNDYVALQDPKNPTAIQTTGCSNITYKLQVTLPFQTNNIVWKIDGVPVLTDANPVVKATTVKDNITLYTYEYNKPVNLTSGTHVVIATVFNPVADVCGSNQDVENDFMIADPAVANFGVSTSNCLGEVATFTDKTVLTTGIIKSWLWDFGDNTTSALQNPTHKYTASGNYPVRLTVTDYNGCASVSDPQSIHIAVKPVAGFVVSTPDCPGQTITFNSASSKATEGVINNWAWDFGDNTKASFTNGQAVTHTYSLPGTYTVKLAVNTDVGCVSDTLATIITVNPLPVVDFTVPDVCLADGSAPFADNSTIADNTEAGFTYLWDFGDANATALNNRSTLKTPRHTYTAVGLYNVKLTVTSATGCSATLQKSFTVNGSNPVANFSPENNCSGDDIIFDDLSSVDAFNITKIVWYFDYNNHPEVSETYTKTTLHSDKRYTHHYPLFNSPPQQTYNVRMDVYSGQTCVNTVYKNVTINANPVIALMYNNTPIINSENTQANIILCNADSPIQINEDKGVYAGSGVFTGTGISSTGLFDPKVSGTGVFTINYLFTSSSTGCTYATTFKITVNATPVVSLLAEYTMLEEGQVTLRPNASVAGGTLTYKWSPSTGLDHDNIANPLVTKLLADTKYTLTVTSDKGCSASAQTLVKVLKAPVVPNTFTPNGDGVNDTWDIKYLNTYPNVTVEIFNRYGSKMYFSNGYPVPWDGRFNGGDLPVGTYYYIINPNSGRKPITGYVSIIR
jgi:gliding motility-associated-like protein